MGCLRRPGGLGELERDSGRHLHQPRVLRGNPGAGNTSLWRDPQEHSPHNCRASTRGTGQGPERCGEEGLEGREGRVVGGVRAAGTSAQHTAHSTQQARSHTVGQGPLEPGAPRLPPHLGFSCFKDKGSMTQGLELQGWATASFSPGPHTLCVCLPCCSCLFLIDSSSPRGMN